MIGRTDEASRETRSPHRLARRYGMGRWLIVIAGFAAVFSGSTSAAQQRPQDEIEILSKADALRLFGLAKEQWIQNVREAVIVGSARETPRTQSSSLIGMTMTNPEGDLLTVNLDYSKGDRRPAFIQVIVGYRSNSAARFTDQKLRDAIVAAQRQMAPEFEVLGNVERPAGGLAIFFHILDRREPVRSAQSQDVVCANYTSAPDSQKLSWAYGYLEGVQAALDKEVADILVPPSNPQHPMWWVLPAELGGNPAKGLAEKLDAHCGLPANQKQRLLDALLALSYRKDGWPDFGISIDRKKTDPWKKVLGGKDTSVSCAGYAASQELTRQAIIYGYYLGTQALKTRFKSSVDVGIVWPSKLNAETVRAEVDRRCQKNQGSTLRDVLWVVTAELGVRER